MGDDEAMISKEMFEQMMDSMDKDGDGTVTKVCAAPSLDVCFSHLGFACSPAWTLSAVLPARA